jgi:nicotinamide-nucleotide amidase
VDALAEELGRRLSRDKAVLAVAESCTGGLVAKRITDIAGSSGWFERGLVVYSNQAKQDLLGVSPDVLAQFGAVSRECAEAMVRGVLVMTPAHWGVAVTGIAGPGGGSPEKPVGMVWVAWERRGGKAETQALQLSGSRQQIREAAAQAALEGLLERLG